MLGLFKKKGFKDISEYPATWGVTQSILEGKPIFVRYRSGLKDAAEHPKYPFQIGVAVPLLDPTSDGLTKSTEGEQLSDIEDSLVSLLQQGNETVEATVITFNGMREFVFYSSEWKPEYYEQKVKSVDAAPHELQFMMKHDPTWNTFKTYSAISE